MDITQRSDRLGDGKVRDVAEELPRGSTNERQCPDSQARNMHRSARGGHVHVDACTGARDSLEPGKGGRIRVGHDRNIDTIGIRHDGLSARPHWHVAYATLT